MRLDSALPRRPVTALERALPTHFRRRLETARLELRALFRAADQLAIGQDLPDELQRLFELDADFAEALHVMDTGPHGINIPSMLRDTEASLAEIDRARSEFLVSLSAREREELEARVSRVRAGLSMADAYIDIPGRDPVAR